MYSIDARDTVTPFEAAPPCSAGAPCPLVLADDDGVLLAYYGDLPADGSSVTTPRAIDPATSALPVVIAVFSSPLAHMFGSPNDEALSGHPLASRGLHAYGSFEVLHSSWVRALERMNAVHPNHRPDSFAGYRHFIFTFHDSTLECVAKGVAFHAHPGPLHSALPHMVAVLGGRA
jgi:hypothetical protein